MSIVEGLVFISVEDSIGNIKNITQSQDFTEISARTKFFALAGDTVYTFLDAFIPKIKNRIGAETLTLNVYGKNRLEDTETLLASLNLSLNDQPVYFAAGIESKVYFSFEIIDTRLLRRWLLFGFQVFGEPDGEYFQ